MESGNISGEARDRSNIDKLFRKYTPALYIGVGGTGTNIVSHIRQKIVAKFQKERPNDWDEIVDSIFQFLVVDFQDRGADAVGIPASNYLNIGGFDGQKLFHNRMKYDPNFEKWWYPEYNSVKIGQEAGMVRINGRLCLLQNLLSPHNIPEVIETCVNRVTNLMLIDAGEYAPFNIYIFTSLCGATGSGIFIDLAYVIRSVLSGFFLRPNIYAYVTTPEVALTQARREDANHLFANAFACLDELDFWQNTKRGVGYEWWIGDTTMIRVSDEDNKGGDWPFDLIYIFHPKNENDIVIHDVNALYRLIADVAIYDSMLSHKENGLKFDIITHYRGTPLWNKHPVNYGSAAVATLRVPIEKITGYIGMNLLSEMIRRYGMKEDEKAAENEKENFLEKVAAIKENILISKIKNDSDFPIIPRAYRTRIEESKKRDLSPTYEKVKKTLSNYESSLNFFFKGKDGKRGEQEELLFSFRDALDRWIDQLFSLPVKDKIPLTSQSVERVVNWVEGKLKSGEEEVQSLVDKIYDLKREKKRIEEQVDEVYREARFPKAFSFSQRKRDLVARFDSLFNITQERIILEQIKSFYEDIKGELHNIKKALKFIRKGVLHEIFNKVEGARDNIWRKTSYDDERGGVVVEILSEEWTKNELQEIKSKESDYQRYVDLIWPDVVDPCVKEIQRTWNDLKKGVSIYTIRKDRRDTLRQIFYDEFTSKAKAVLKSRYQNLSIWNALEEEMGAYAKNKEEMQRGIDDKLTEFVRKASPWWPIRDGDLRSHNLYQDGIVKVMAIMRLDEEAYKEFHDKYRGVDATGIFTKQRGNCTIEENHDIYSIQIIYFKYGAPLHLLTTLNKYREHKNRWQKMFPGIPLYTDRRYEDPDWVTSTR